MIDWGEFCSRVKLVSIFEDILIENSYIEGSKCKIFVEIYFAGISDAD